MTGSEVASAFAKGVLSFAVTAVAVGVGVVGGAYGTEKLNAWRQKRAMEEKAKGRK